MRLNELPADILREILRGSNSYLVIELWKCGNPQLQRTLANHGVEEVNLLDKKRFSASRWPRMLKHLQLRSLAIESSSPLGSDALIRKELLSLHHGLQSLTLRFEWAAEALFGMEGSLAAEAPPPAKRAKKAPRAATSHSLESHSVPMHSCFPLLAHLDLVDSNYYSNKLRREHWRLLPQSLASLVLGVSFIEELTGLPTSLTRLELPQISLDSSLASELPASLIELHAHIREESVLDDLLTAEKSGRMPNLDPFPFTSFAGLRDLDPVRKSGGWPKNTKTLHLSDVDAKTFVGLLPPSSLTKLSLSLLPSHRHFQPHLVALPATLTQLSTSAIDWKGVRSKPSCLPPSLTSLVLHKDPKFEIRHFPLLPRKLKELHVKSNNRPRNHLAGTEADEEETLDAMASACQLLWEADAESWTTLQQLSVDQPHRFCKDNLDAIASGHHFGLPLTLTSLDISAADYELPIAATLILTPYVTKASLPRYACIDASFLFQLLPPSITDLSIPDASNADPSTLITWVAVKELDLHHIGRNLVSFHLSYIDCDFTPALFSSLPRTLKEFSSTNPRRMDVALLLNLPRELKSLSLDCTFYLENWPAALPRHLVSASLRNAQMYGFHMDSLPRQLEHLTVSTFRGLLTEHLARLPSTILSIGGAFVEESDIEGEGAADAFYDPRFDTYAGWGYMLSLRHLFPPKRSMTFEELENIANQYEEERTTHAKHDIDPRSKLVD